MTQANINFHYNFECAMYNPYLQVYRDDYITIINDRFPKSAWHFLVMPFEKISTVRSLTYEHLDLLMHMDRVTNELIKLHPDHRFKWGFHANPTIVQLHLHVLSDDLTGLGMKSVEIYNANTTSFFVPLSKVISDLETKGEVELPSYAICEKIRFQTPIKCHKCDYLPPNFHTLKSHLLLHDQEIFPRIIF